ncbi:UNVERIFIED_CONTAM: hypothetical protein PYX00_011049 [Menopon gallinae]|uniref:Threonyl-tRNA synthetase n=1 Tax=Menopon gallinae TaxID=328185 RepID=A0AAW2H6V8_9NEOP
MMPISSVVKISKIKAYLSTKPQKAVGEQDKWDLATSSLKKALIHQGLDYELDEGGGAFYGPKIDLKIQDSMQREWQMSTIQFDFNLPERFNMTYIDRSGQKRRPFMIHRALLGSLERFFGVLIEHFAGAFPVWLAPVQARVVSVSEKYEDYAFEIFEFLRQKGIRVEHERSDKRLSAKIREAQEEKIPYILIVGEKEVQNRSVSLRLREGKQQNDRQWQEVVDEIKLAIAEKR